MKLKVSIQRLLGTNKFCSYTRLIYKISFIYKEPFIKIHYNKSVKINKAWRQTDKVKKIFKIVTSKNKTL